jgi:hypothetical protein
MMPEIVLDPPSRVEQHGRSLVMVPWRGWLVVAAIALVGAVGAYAYAKAQPPVYKASGRMFLTADVANGQDPMRLVNTQAQLAISTPVLVQMSEQLSLPVEVVQERLTVIPSDKGDYFTIAGTGATPAAAVELVTAAQRAYQQVVKALRQRLSGSRATSPAGAPIQLAEAPQLPTAPAPPKPLWIGVVGGLLGAILGVALVWWRSERVAVAAAKEPSDRPTRLAADAQAALPAGPDEAHGRPNLSGSPQRERRRAALTEQPEQRGVAAIDAGSELDRPGHGPTAPRLSPAAPWEPARRLDNGSGSTSPPAGPPMHRARRAFNPLRSTPAQSPEAGEAEARGEEAPDAAQGTAGAPTLTPELSVAFNRLTDSLQEVMETLRLDGWSVAERSLPQMEAEKAALYFGLAVAVILLDDGRGRLEVAGEVGWTPIERRKAIRYDPDLWRAIFSAGPRVMEEEDRARFAEAGIRGGVGETVLMIPLVYEDVGFGLLLASAHADGEESPAFNERNIESIAAYAHVIEPALWSWVLLGRLKLSLGGER